MMGEGACTPIAEAKKGKDSERLKKLLVFQLLLAVIAAIQEEANLIWIPQEPRSLQKKFFHSKEDY